MKDLPGKTRGKGLFRRLGLFIIVFAMAGQSMWADYTSKSNYTGNYEDAASWIAQGWGDPYPQLNGNVAAKMIINGTITRNGDINPVTVEVNGRFNVTGNYTNSQWGGLLVNSGGVVEIFGDLSGSAAISVVMGGTLIVHGNLSSTGSSVDIKGDLIVMGNFSTSSGTKVSGNGVLVVGGDFTHAGGGLSVRPDNLYILDPNATIVSPGWGDIEAGNYGDIEDFQVNESENTALIDLVTDLGIIVSTTTWTGGVSSDWSVAGNWSLGTVPSGNANLVVTAAANQPEISGSLLTVINQLTINVGATLTVKPGSKLTVTGNMENNGQLVLEHSTESPSSFIHNGTTTGTGDVKITHTIVKDKRNFYIGHAVTGSNYDNYAAANADPVTNLGLFYYNTPLTGNNGWIRVTAASAPEVRDLGTPMKGYTVQFKVPNAQVSQVGQLHSNSSTQSYNMLKTGWHLVSNPYPSYIDLNAWTDGLGNAAQSIWMYTNTAGGQRVFATYNITAGVGTGTGGEVMSRYIAPLQGFWVKALTPGLLTIQPTYRTHGDGAALKSASSVSDILRLNLSSQSVSDQTVVVFRSIGQPDYSEALDSEKRVEANASIPYLWSVKSGKQIAINLMPEDPTQHIVPLAMTVGAAGAGTITLNAADIDNFRPEVDVVLFDRVAGIEVNLRKKPEYTFETGAVTNHERFELRFKTLVPERDEAGNKDDADNAPAIATAAPVAQSDGYRITAIGMGNKAVVKVVDVAFDGNVGIELIDASGKTQLSATYKTERTSMDVPSRSPFYIVKVTYKGKLKTFKIMTF